MKVIQCKILLCAVILCVAVAETEANLHNSHGKNSGFFKSITREWLRSVNSDQRNYGIAVTDVDKDGDFEIFVAGYSGPNLVLKYNEENKRLENIAVGDSPYENLMDPTGNAIGVCACDIDGDGREEIYVLNTNQAYSGRSSYGDKLFKYRNGKYVDLFSDHINRNVDAKDYAGRSVACVDRNGNGKYAIAVATYSEDKTGMFALIEMNEKHRSNDVDRGHIVIHNVAREAGIQRATGGRGIVVGPILNNDGKQDIFFGNEGNDYLGNNGENFLFRNLGNGSFVDVARSHGVADRHQNARGIAITDVNNDGLIDLVVGNWVGHHRLYIQEKNKGSYRTFKNEANTEFAHPSAIRTVIAADFDNDGHLEVLFNNIYYRQPQPNKLFRIVPTSSGDNVRIDKLDIGDAVESNGYGTGGAAVDIDRDGTLEVILSHGESRAQPLEVYVPHVHRNSSWIRVLPLTRYGAPARGAKVTLEMTNGKIQTRVIDSGSGYLCQMEPVAHFGLSTDSPTKLSIIWPDTLTHTIQITDTNKLYKIEHPGTESNAAANMEAVLMDEIEKSIKSGKNNSGKNHSHNHNEL